MSRRIFKKLSIKECIEKTKIIRKDIIDICVKNGAGHIAPSMSSIDVLVSLYYNVLNISDDPLWNERDRLIYSKAHGCYGVYAILSDLGYIERGDWINFYQGSFLSGCLERSIEHGLEASCGSLGHGLPMAVGIAFGAKLQNKKYRIYCIVGDGEMQEGSNWEALQFAAKHKLTNLTIIIDCNALQAMDFLVDVLSLQSDISKEFNYKLKSFGFDVKNCNGHSVKSIINRLNAWLKNKDNLNKPQVLLAKTIKGYGLKCMENIPKFHFRLPTKEDLKMGNRYE